MIFNYLNSITCISYIRETNLDTCRTNLVTQAQIRIPQSTNSVTYAAQKSLPQHKNGHLGAQKMLPKWPIHIDLKGYFLSELLLLY